MSEPTEAPNLHPEPDEALAARVSRDRQAFAELYKRHVGSIYRYVRYQTRCTEEAQDVTSQVFFQAYRAAGQFRGDGATYRTWLFRIAHNAVATWRRTRSRVPVPVPHLPDVDRFDDELADVTDRDATRVLVAQLMAQLPSRDRALIELHYVEGLGAREIAEITGSTYGAVRVRLHRLLRRLRAILERRGITA